MNEEEQIKSWERVANLLSSEEVATFDELRADLEQEGIDVAKNVQSLRTMIRQRYQARLRETANAERASSLERLQLTVAEIAAWPLGKLRHWLGEAERG